MFTDSIIYIDDGASYTIPVGDALGEFSNELEADDYIVKFISTGPKSYYYETQKGCTCTKMKGFTLHHELLKVINGETMKQLIDREISIIEKSTRILRDVEKKEIVNRVQKKRLVFDYNKRILTEKYNTVPYGYTSALH